MQGMQVWSLGQEDFLEKDMATHSSILAWRIPCTEEPGRLQSMGSQVGHDLVSKQKDLYSTWFKLQIIYAQTIYGTNHLATILADSFGFFQNVQI